MKYVLYAFGAGACVELLLAILQLSQGHAIQSIFYLIGERHFTLSTPDIAKGSFHGYEFLRSYGSFSHPNSMGGFYLLFFTFILVHKMTKSYPRVRYLLLALSSALVFMSFSKVAIGTYLAILITYIILHSRITSKLVKGIIITGIVTIALIFATTQGDPLTIDKRIRVYGDALTIIVHNPVSGVGLGSYLYAQATFPIKEAYFFLQPVHNIFLLLIAEAGFILGVYMLYQLYLFFKVHYKKPEVWYLIAAVAMTGMFDHYWLTLQQNFLLMAVVFALL